MTTETSGRSISHFALHYPEPSDGPLAARLFELLGVHVDEPLPLPDGTNFYRFWVDKRPGVNDGIFYMSRLPEPLRNLQKVIRERLDVGGPNEDPTVAAYRTAEDYDPELCFHVGVLFASLDDLEERVAAVRADPELSKRVSLTVNRATKGKDPAIDARMEASPLFSAAERFPYGNYGIQIFLVTDLLAGGPLGERMTVELDYVFPGYPENVFTTVVWQ